MRIEGFFASHPLEEDRIAATQRDIAELDPSVFQGLRQDDPSYQAFKAHLATLPRAPERAPDPVPP
jgi:beta-barrel assembly-enhancing protease